jgi:DNA replication protein DnaC
VTDPHASSPAAEHPPTACTGYLYEDGRARLCREPGHAHPSTDGRPTLAQIEAAAAANPPGTPPPRPPVTGGPEPTAIDWQAHVLAIAERSRPRRQAQAAARTRRETILAEQRADRARTVNRARSAAQVPARYRNATPDHPAVAAWAEDVATGRAHDGIVLNGPTGCGKTWQAYGAWSLIAERTGCRAVALPVPAYLDSLRPGRTPLVPLDQVERAEVLLLDDLAGERSSEWTVEVVYRLIDARWNACLPTIVTLNAPVRDLPDGRRVSSLREQLGDRVASRLNGLGRVVSWPADAPDRRIPTTD